MATAKKKAVKKATPRVSPIHKHIERLGLDEKEAMLVLQSAKGEKPLPTTRIPISGKEFVFGYFSDPHVGQKKFNPHLFDYMVRYFKKEKPDFICNPGDHLEGMSGRPGHVYELAQIGYAAQLKYCVELYSELDQFDHYGIDGNHDQWYYIKNTAGAIVGSEIQARVKNYHHLGQDEGNLTVKGVNIRLFHANDGSAYAISYKLQKLIESYSGGEKPNIVLSGHYHKALSLFSRGIHGFECGTLCGQTGWMRGKKIQAHMGFGLVKVAVNNRGVERLTHTWVPWYE